MSPSIVPLWLLAILALAGAAQAQVSLSPGGSATLSGSDVTSAAGGGDTSCAIGGVSVSCFLPANLGTLATPAANTVNAANVALIPSGFGIPHDASARIYDDFAIEGSGGVVSVQITAIYDASLGVGGAAAYNSSAEVTLSVDDVTNASDPIAVGSVTLAERSRSGDQGFTDVSIGTENHVVSGEAGSLSLQLQRGRTYRVSFGAAVSGQQLVVGTTSETANATLRRVIVQIDEDEVEQLATHDADVKLQLALIEKKIDDLAAAVALMKRTQLEQSLVSNSESRLTVLHSERAAEVCDAAQRAIDSSGEQGYAVKASAQRKLDEGRAAQESDPKLAVKLCRNAYRSAAYGSTKE